MRRETSLIDLIFPGDTNHHGTLFGGAALAHMDKVAFIAATRHAHVDFVTASCERIDFAAPAHLGEIVEVTGRIARVGRRSLTVEVDLVAEALLTGERRLCTRGRFNMVSVDRDAAVPPLEETEPAPATAGVRMVELVFPDQASHNHILFGGHAMAQMGKAAFVAATRHCRRTVVLAASQRLDFTSPVKVGEIMEIEAAVTGTGTSSMQVTVDLWGENLKTGERRKAAEGVFVMVALDADQRPTPVRPL